MSPDAGMLSEHEAGPLLGPPTCGPWVFSEKIGLVAVLLGELGSFSQETASGRRMTQVVLRLVFLMEMPF